MTDVELMERLAEAEHASWSRWMDYLFSKCEPNIYDGTVSIPHLLVERWTRQAKTAYADLSPSEQESDRDEVRHILPIIGEYCRG